MQDSVYVLSETIGRLAEMSLLYEVSASPKPGLVDRFNQGAHTDMDFFTFMSSSAALHTYFIKCALTGAEFQGGDMLQLFSSLRHSGIEAEKAMLRATNGVNTHKGLIFSLGLISAASSYCWRKGRSAPNAEQICTIVAEMSQGLCARELANMNKAGGLTHGEKLYREYGLTGIRGEAESGFKTVRDYSLPFFTKLKSEKSYHLNDVLVQTLLHIMTVNEDTNIVSRKDLKELEYVRKCAKKALHAGGMFSKPGIRIIKKMDRDFIKRNISPGGSADLLAVTVMLYLVTQHC